SPGCSPRRWGRCCWWRGCRGPCSSPPRGSCWGWCPFGVGWREASPRRRRGLVRSGDGLQAALAAGVAVAAMLVWHRVIAGHFDWLPHTFFWRLVPLASDALVFTVTYVAVLHAQGIPVLRVLWMLRPPRPAAAPVLPAQPDPGEPAEAPVL